MFDYQQSDVLLSFCHSLCREVCREILQSVLKPKIRDIMSSLNLRIAKSRSSQASTVNSRVFCSTLKAYLQNHKSFMREDFTTLWEWIARHYSRAVQRHYCFVLIIAIIDVVPWWRSEIWWMNEAHFDLVWCCVHFKFQKKRLNLETFQFPSVFPSFLRAAHRSNASSCPPEKLTKKGTLVSWYSLALKWAHFGRMNLQQA